MGFVQPFTVADGQRFFIETIGSQVLSGERELFIARNGTHTGAEIGGTVQLILGLPANQQHRCEFAKMMVHPRADGVHMDA